MPYLIARILIYHFSHHAELIKHPKEKNATFLAPVNKPSEITH